MYFDTFIESSTGICEGSQWAIISVLVTAAAFYFNASMITHRLVHQHRRFIIGLNRKMATEKVAKVERNL